MLITFINFMIISLQSFYILVNKSDIHAELSGVRFTPKHNEITIVFDAICLLYWRN